MTTPRLADVPVTTPHALRQRWATVLDPPVFATRSLWVMWLRTSGAALPTVVPVDDVPRRPDAPATRNLAELAATVCTEATGGEGHVAFALCRPGHAACTGSDQEWADQLGDALSRAGLKSWSLHLAAGGDVVPLVAPPWPDDGRPR